MPRKTARRQADPTIWRYQAVNALTGEIVDLETAHTHHRWHEQHVRVFQAAIVRLAIEGTLGKEAWRVLGYLLGMLDWDNWIVVPQVSIAQALRMRPAHVSRAIRTLVDRKILLQAPPPKPRATYRLNSAVAYKGQYNGWQKRRREETYALAANPFFTL